MHIILTNKEKTRMISDLRDSNSLRRSIQIPLRHRLVIHAIDFIFAVKFPDKSVVDGNGLLKVLHLYRALLLHR